MDLTVTPTAQAVALTAPATGPMTFTDVIFGAPSPVLLIILAVVAAIVGMLAHWAKAYYKDQDAEELLQYFFVKNKKATFMTVASMLGTLAATLGPLEIGTVTVFQVLTQSFMVGYVADSTFNTDVPKTPPPEAPPAGAGAQQT